MTKFAVRWVAAQWLRATGRSERNRRRYYRGTRGLRILNFHAISRSDLPKFEEIVEWCLHEFDVVGPAEIDGLKKGCFRQGGRDQIAFTFDDGYDDHYAAARWLSERNVKATFFVVPSFLGRSITDYLRFHEERGIKAFDFTTTRTSVRGLTRGQVKEMAGMGHRVAAHNYAHRDLGSLSQREDMEYEIEPALRAVEDLTGTACQDFAFAFGHPQFISDEAVKYLQGRCNRVYACVRGLNVPGLTPAFLLREDIILNYPSALVKECIKGGADDRYEGYRADLVRRTGILPVAVSGTA